MSKARGLADLGNVYNDGALSNRNLIINGAMQVAQRGTSTAGISGNGYYTVDRVTISTYSLGVWTSTQEATDGPNAAFPNSLKLECTTADAAPAGPDELKVGFKIEAQDLQRLQYGSADAQDMTLSFWAKSNKTGTYIAYFYRQDTTRHVQSPVTIDVANAWEYKTVTISGDVTGQINNDSGDGLQVMLVLGAGSNGTTGTAATAWEAFTAANRYVGQTVNLADTIGNYFQITGVQLEVGDTATPFEHRSYGQELALCQRYYFTTWPTGTALGTNITATRNLGVAMAGNSIKVVGGGLTLPVEMRATPSVSTRSPTGLTGKYYEATSALDFTYNYGAGIWAGTKYIGLDEYDAGATANRAGYTHLFCDAEL